MSRLIKVFSIALVLVLLLGLFPLMPVKAEKGDRIVYIFFKNETSEGEYILEEGESCPTLPDELKDSVEWNEDEKILTIKDLLPSNDEVTITLTIVNECKIIFKGSNVLQIGKNDDGTNDILRFQNPLTQPTITVEGVEGASLELKNISKYLDDGYPDNYDRFSNIFISGPSVIFNNMDITTEGRDNLKKSIYIYGGHLTFTGMTYFTSNSGSLISTDIIDGPPKQGVTFDTGGVIKFIGKSYRDEGEIPAKVINGVFNYIGIEDRGEIVFENKGRVEFKDTSANSWAFVAKLADFTIPGGELIVDEDLKIYQPEDNKPEDNKEIELVLKKFYFYSDYDNNVTYRYIGGAFKKECYIEKQDNSNCLAGHVVIVHGSPTKQVTVSFDGNGAEGTAPAAMTGKPGDPLNLPDAGDLKKDGHEFLGWNTNETAGTALTDFNVFPDKYTTLYAIWKKVLSEVTVSFDGNGAEGTAPAVMTGKPGEPLSLPDAGNLIKVGCEFLGWNKDKKAGTALTDYNQFPSENETLYAIWGDVDDHKIKFDPNGNNVFNMPSDTTIKHNAILTRPTPDPSRTDYKFVDWQIIVLDRRGINEFGGRVTSDLLLRAIWEEKPEPSTSESTTTSVSSETTKSSTVIIAPQYNLWTPKPSDPQAGGAVPPAKVVSKVDNAKLAPVTKAIPVTGESKLYSVLGVILLGLAAVMIFKKKA